VNRVPSSTGVFTGMAHEAREEVEVISSPRGPTQAGTTVVHHRSGLDGPYADYGHEQVGEDDPEGDPERQLERSPAALVHC